MFLMSENTITFCTFLHFYRYKSTNPPLKPLIYRNTWTGHKQTANCDTSTSSRALKGYRYQLITDWSRFVSTSLCKWVSTLDSCTRGVLMQLVISFYTLKKVLSTDSHPNRWQTFSCFSPLLPEISKHLFLFLAFAFQSPNAAALIIHFLSYIGWLPKKWGDWFLRDKREHN